MTEAQFWRTVRGMPSVQTPSDVKTGDVMENILMGRMNSLVSGVEGETSSGSSKQKL